jgi:hypothetical protein
MDVDGSNQITDREVAARYLSRMVAGWRAFAFVSDRTADNEIYVLDTNYRC